MHRVSSGPSAFGKTHRMALPWLSTLLLLLLAAGCGPHLKKGGVAPPPEGPGDQATMCVDGFEIDREGFPVIDVLSKGEFKQSRRQCTSLSESRAVGGTVLQSICSNNDPTARINANPGNFFRRRCAARCDSGKCIGLLPKCEVDTLTVPGGGTATCTRAGTCRSGKPLWSCTVTVAVSGYRCSCGCP